MLLSIREEMLLSVRMTSRVSKTSIICEEMLLSRSEEMLLSVRMTSTVSKTSIVCEEMLLWISVITTLIMHIIIIMLSLLVPS